MSEKLKRLGPNAKAAGSTIGAGATVAGLVFGILHWAGIQPPLEVITYGTGVMIFLVNRLIARYL